MCCSGRSFVFFLFLFLILPFSSCIVNGHIKGLTCSHNNFVTCAFNMLSSCSPICVFFFFFRTRHIYITRWLCFEECVWRPKVQMWCWNARKLPAETHRIQMIQYVWGQISAIRSKYYNRIILWYTNRYDNMSAWNVDAVRFLFLFSRFFLMCCSLLSFISHVYIICHKNTQE